MRRLSDTIDRLHRGYAVPAALPGGAATRLKPLAATGANPGNLKAWCHVPDANDPMPLVVVLHGCTQSAAGYDLGSGWSVLAEAHRFAVVFPEQQRANNPNLCFNWFSPDDTRRGSGEALSIREMVATMVERYAIDPARVFVTGLSAGGAMATSLLASYPDVFAGGAIVAGLSAGAASTMPQAFDRMRGHGHADATRAAAHVRQASDHRGPWPVVSVWHGSADATVAPSNAEATLRQWRAINDLPAAPDLEETVDGAVHREWRDRDGRVRLEDWRIAGMGHGTPVATAGATACGSPGPYMLDVGISSTWRSAARWGLLDPAVTVDRQRRTGEAPQPAVVYPRPGQGARPGIQDTIEAALRSAGMMR
ncbi:extracellular catalytic domain type 1 short-chain-length polyhydroxyalkanoate depolymerase [Sphingomonas bacterium]|uniref:extracellular catalytic domain type 1 short-chain-length polyhydroxyalkanoate depolymerase n=1 Tax=Sphingomonas bacterium TaxID=1895847 RepID=UPI0015764A68|nr:PHB depolymerase family esterase [Sphingomonas bacterium]